MKKIILVPLLLLIISSCTLPFGNKNEVSSVYVNDGSFLSLYNASIRSSMESIEEYGKYLGINRNENIDGSIVSSLSIPGILSGSLESKYAWVIDGRNSESFFRNIRVLFSSLVSSGSLSVDEIWLISQGTDSYISYKNIVDVGIIPEELKPIFKKYEKTWLNITENSLSEMSAEELFGYNITKNLLTKSLSDIEKYATDFPIWKNTADLGMSWSLHVWAVELDRANMIALAKKLTQDLAGTWMTDDNIKELETNFSLLSFSWKLGFDPKNPKISSMEGIITLSGQLIGQITVSKDETNTSIQIGNPDKKENIVVSYQKTELKNTFTASINQWGIEMGKILGYVENKDGKFKELSVEASAQGMTASLKHSMDGDKFSGKISAVVGTIEWSWTMNSDRLTWFKINGTAPFGSLSADLTNNGSDPMVKWPVTIKAGQETLVSANIALEVAREKFGLIIDVLSEQFPVHFDVMISWKTTPSDKKIVAPSSTKSLQDFANEIEALSPTEDVSTFSDANMDTSLEQITSDSVPAIQ
jgi:hypothetical protein